MVVLAGIAFGSDFDDTDQSMIDIPSGIYASPFLL